MFCWIESGNVLNGELDTNFERNSEHMKSLHDETNTLKDTLAELNKSVADGFDNIKTSAAGYEETLRSNDKFMNDHLIKLEAYSKNAKKQLVAQVNTLTNTANVVAGQVQLAESSIDKQHRKLTDAVDALMTSATSSTATASRSSAMSLVPVRFQTGFMILIMTLGTTLVSSTQTSR